MDKLKHISGIYTLLPDSPQPEDILYLFKQKKRKQMSIAEIEKIFGMEKSKKIADSLGALDFENKIQKIDETTYKLS